jgi:urea transporter
LTVGNSFGQIFLQEYWISGVLFFVGIAISTPKGALYALISVLLSTLIAKLVSLPDSQIYTGLIGYNAVLCALAFSNSRRMATLWIVVSVFLSLFIFEFIGLLGVIPLTASFVVTTWIENALKRRVNARKQRKAKLSPEL